MANTVDISKLVDTADFAVIHVYLASDGVAGELTDTVIVDASALAGANNVKNIIYIDACLVGFSARIEADGTTDAGAIVLPADIPVTFDFSKNNFSVTSLSTLVGATGDLTITTNGFTAAGDQGFIIIKVKKS